MAEYTVLNKHQIVKILAEFTTYKVLTTKLLSGGSENTNYLITTENKKYVLTICQHKSIQDTENLANLLELLAKHDFPTSVLVHTLQKKSMSLFNGKPVLLKEYIEGEIIEDLPNDILQSLGKQLGLLHKIKAPAYLPDEPGYGTDKFSIVASYAPETDFYYWLIDMRKIILDSISPTLPKALIHADVFYNNVIVNKGSSKATIMDFEEACNYYRVFDIGMMIIGLCSEGAIINLQKVRYLLLGYKEEIELIAEEKQYLKIFTAYAATATSYWRHMQFNYLEPEIMMKDHYLVMKNLADHAMQLDDDFFKDI